MNSVAPLAGKVKTGIWGLDNILSGGFSWGHRRRVCVVKYRGVKFRGGYHDATITTGRLNVFLRLVASEYRANLKRVAMSCGTIREYRIGKNGLTIGGPLDGFQGVLRGVPVYIGGGKPLLEEQPQ
ncbi:MAG TPA: hypothetical protein VFQ87_14195 [Bradyrhizobium sp.]|jgi:hypothetical protein|nr:hypothetical protein [Bradyrhizobium sp.]